MAKPPPLCGSPAMNDSARKSSAVPLMTTRGRADGVDHRPAGGVAQHVDLAAFGAVEERLAHVAVDDQLAALADLAKLVLGVAVDVDFQAVHARAEVVARVVVAVDPQAVGVAGRSRRRGTACRGVL